MKTQVTLQKMESDRKILWESDSEFLLEYQKAVLLALKEAGTLDEQQYCHAQERLKDQCLTFAKKKVKMW